MHKLLIAAAFLFAPAAAHAEDWVLVTVTDDRTGAMFVDADSLGEADGSIRGARVLAVAREDIGGMAAGLGQVSFDCAAHTLMINSNTEYDIAGKQGRTVGVTPWRAVLRGTVFFGTMQVVCGERPLDGERFGATLPIAAGREMLKRNDP